MPIHLVMVVVAGLLWGQARECDSDAGYSWAMPGFALLIGVQFLALAWNPYWAVPQAPERRAWESIRTYVANLPGTVWVTQRPTLSRQAGKGRYMNWDSYFWLSRGRTVQRLGPEIECCEGEVSLWLRDSVDWVLHTDSSFCRDFHMEGVFEVTDSLDRLGLTNIEVEDTARVPRWVYRNRLRHPLSPERPSSGTTGDR